MRLSGPLPPQWSAMTALHALWLGEHSLTGTLPKEWSTLQKLTFMSVKSNLLTGTVPPEWSSLQMSTLYASGNWLEGSLPHCWDDTSDDRISRGFLDFKVNHLSAAPESYGDADNMYNCMASEDDQRMCPSRWLPLLMAAVLILSLVGVLILEAAARGWEVPLADLRFAVQRLAKTPVKRHFTKSNMLLMAALNAMCQRLFILSPAFSAVERAFIARTSSYLGVAGSETARLLARTVCSMLPIVATLLIVVGFLGLSVLVSLPRLEWLPKKLALQAWTLVASEDILRDNLQTLKIDQLLLLGMFLVCSLVVPLVLFLGLPEVIAIREVDPSVFWGANSTTVQLIYLPRSMMSLLAASYIIVIYGMVAALLIPGAVMWPSVAVNEAVRATGAAPRVQQSLRQLRRLRWAVPQALLSLVLCATCMALFSATEWREVDDYGDNESGLSTVWGSKIEAGVISTMVGFQVICAIGWNLAVWGINRTSPVTDVVAVAPADEEAAPSDVVNGSSKEAISFCQLTSCKSTAAWAASSAATSPTRGSSSRPGLRPAASDRSSSARGPGRWLPEVSMVGQARARDNALLLVTVLQMLHVDGARVGPVVAWLTWLASIAILCWALLVRDAPMRFDDIHECAAFGMVVVASDLAAILKADLAADDGDCSSAEAPPYPHRVNLVDSQATSSSSSEEEDCCADYPAGCPRCQLLLRRVPATLYRMQETLCISYRWQSQVRAVVRPPGHGPVAPASGLRNRVAGINMTRWQREQLLSAILRSSCTYVWLDVLSIPTALEPPEGTRLWELSEMLMARMMAVYATAGCTLALLSNETEGERYCQRAWTLQEYCVARRLDVVCQSATSSEAALAQKTGLSFRKVLAGISMRQLGQADETTAFANEEVARYQELRKYVRQSMSTAVPLWIRLLMGHQSMAIDEVDERATLYAKVVGTVNCQEQVDLVRALAPVLFNTSVQTMEELHVLVRESSRAVPEGSAGSEAMKSAESLLGIEGRRAR